MTIDYDDPSSTPSSAPGDHSKPAQVAERAGAEASNVASTAVEGVREVTDEVKSQAGAVAGEARQQIEELLGQARGEFREQAQQRNDQAATQLRSLSGQLVALAEGRPEDAGPLASYAREAEDQVRRLAARLEQGGPQGVVDDVSRFARRRPGLFLAGAMAAGFVLGRAVRATAASQSSTSAGQFSTDEISGWSAQPPSVPDGPTPLTETTIAGQTVLPRPDGGTTGVDTISTSGPVIGEPLIDPDGGTQR